MAKVKKTKWALSGEEPEDLQDFLSNDEIEDKHGQPPKGIYRCAVRRLTVKPNKNGDDRISVMLSVKEPKSSDKARFNGYVIWDGLNVTEQAAPFIKRFLKALGLTWSDFMNKTKQNDDDPPHIVQIGGVKFEHVEDPMVRVTTRFGQDQNNDTRVEVGRYMPIEDEEPEASDEEEEDEDEEDVTVVSEDEEDEADEDESDEDEDEDEEDEEDEDEDEDEEDEEPLTAEDLEDWDDDDLREYLTDNEIKKPATVKKATRKQMIKWIVAHEQSPPF